MSVSTQSKHVTTQLLFVLTGFHDGAVDQVGNQMIDKLYFIT